MYIVTLSVLVSLIAFLIGSLLQVVVEEIKERRYAKGLPARRAAVAAYWAKREAEEALAAYIAELDAMWADLPN